MSFFRVIIPAYNNRSTIERAYNSVKNQTFKDYVLVLVDDCSDDGTGDWIDAKNDGEKVIAVHTDAKRWNGGARNFGTDVPVKSEYTIFLDADDNFISDSVFKKLHDFIVVNRKPDMVRLPYYRVERNGKRINQTPKVLAEKNICDVAHNCRVACWTKAVKSSKLQRFPEDTLMEDVCQHLMQCDVTKSVAWFPYPVIDWHIRSSSTSNSHSPKWVESAYRFPYDLYSLQLTRACTRKRRDDKIKESLDNLRNGRHLQ